jgi:hypothetical protein
MSYTDADSASLSGAPDAVGPARHPRWLGAVLWFLAVILMLATASYQRRTGPTYELRETMTVEGQTYAVRLIRSQETTEQARVAIPAPTDGITAQVLWRRYPTDDAFAPLPMAVETVDGESELVAYLPIQPSAGKLEYWVEVQGPDGTVRLPDLGGGTEGGDTAILRYKDPVPLALLLSHVLCMFFAVLIGMRAALGALFAPFGIRRLAWISFGLMSVGGMILGPFVQKFAFGAYWTGWPFGYDLTDNKTLIMWGAWAVACFILHRRADEGDRMSRLTVLVATVVMVSVYLIPHSMRGSELNYEAVDSGTEAAEAIGTSRN